MNQIIPVSGKTQLPSSAFGAVMPHEAAAPSEPDHDLTFSFGPFCLIPMQRLLLRDGQPISLGSRALDILIALVERGERLVSKRELMGRVWPNTFVEEANITVHITALRRAIGDGRDGNRDIINDPGRGYRFVAPVTSHTPARSAALRRSMALVQDQSTIDLTDLIDRAGAGCKAGEQPPALWIVVLLDVDGVAKPIIATATVDELSDCLRTRFKSLSVE